MSGEKSTKRASMPLPSELVLPVPVKPDAPTREDLLDRLRKKRQTLRAGGIKPAVAPVKSKKEAKKVVERFSSGNVSSSEGEKMKELEELMEECNGDMSRFCARAGIDASMVPALQTAFKSLQEGKDPKAVISAAAESVLKTAENMRR